MELDETICHIGKSLNQNCDITKCVQFESLSNEEKGLLKWRADLHDFTSSSRVCFAHREEFLRKYSFFKHKSCFDPYSKHKKKIKVGLREINLHEARQIKNTLNLDIIPGMQCCSNCFLQINENIKEIEDNIATSQEEKALNPSSTPDKENNSFPSTSTASYEQVHSQALSNISDQDSEICKDKIEVIFDTLSLPAISMKGIKDKSKDQYLKRQLEDATDEIRKKMKTAFHLETDIEVVPADIKEKAQNYDEMMENVKCALESCKHPNKLQLLTLVPNVQKQKIQKFLGIPRATAEAAVKLKETKGLFLLPDKKLGSVVLSKEVTEEVHKFYCDDTSGNSKLLPGKKDCVSIGNKQYKQKQLLLLNLRELYTAFKDSHSESRIGFSSFCLLRPKWCVLSGTPGTHSVCVCTIHQNVDLLIFATHSKLSSNEIISNLVCNDHNRECMLRTCVECPKKDTIKTILANLLFPKSRQNVEGKDGDDKETEQEDYEEEDELIQFKEWNSTDRAELRSHELLKFEFLEHLSDAFEKLLPHAYVTKEQFKYLRNLKETLEADACIIMMDFSENYNYIVQDQAQAFYWTKDSCTIHPTIIYYKNGDKLEHINICFISDDLKHDVKIVHIFQDRIIENYVKKMLPHVEKIHYVSDGCPGQYKNCQNFLHLCQHQKIYGLDATWTFFTTSHGKSPCDGIGATIKREAANESLRRAYENQITNVDMLFNFCKEHISSVFCEIVTKSEVESKRSTAVEKAYTIPGTRTFHEFVPLTDQIIQCKIVSTDNNYTLKFDLIINKKCK